MNHPVALVGGGIIGASWALVFARAGFSVRLYARNAATRASLFDRIAASAEAARAIAPDVAAEAILARITLADSLEAALDGADYVQESLEENLDLKKTVFAELDRLAAPEAVLASSTSSIGASFFAPDLAGRHRCLVAHPLAPPHLIPVVEVVAAPFTSAGAVEKTFALMRAIGQSPVRVNSEQPGFVLNRLQGALITEMIRTIEAGIMTPDDIDTLISDGFGLRWAFLGPLEGVDLNAPGGIADYLTRYGFMFDRLAAERGGKTPVATPEVTATIATAMRAKLPLDAIPDRVAWRDRRMAALRALRRED